MSDQEIRYTFETGGKYDRVQHEMVIGIDNEESIHVELNVRYISYHDLRKIAYKLMHVADYVEGLKHEG